MYIYIYSLHCILLQNVLLQIRRSKGIFVAKTMTRTICQVQKEHAREIDSMVQ